MSVFRIILIQFHRAIRENTVQTVIVHPIEIKTYYYCKMASTSFEERSQASYVFPLDHNNLMIMTMIVIVMSLVGTTA